MSNLVNPYRNASGARYYSGLFYERANPVESALYTIKDYDSEYMGRVYPSLYRLYLSERDVLEYTFANKYLDGWEHWTTLCDQQWFKPLATRWRHELELIIRSEALDRLRQDAASNSRSAAMSNRLLLERGWSVEKNTKGRPSKAEIKKEANRLAQDRYDLQADAQRVAASLPTELLTKQ
jgi:hypothetical protein